MARIADCSETLERNWDPVSILEGRKAKGDPLVMPWPVHHGWKLQAGNASSCGRAQVPPPAPHRAVRGVQSSQASVLEGGRAVLPGGSAPDQCPFGTACGLGSPKEEAPAANSCPGLHRGGACIPVFTWTPWFHSGGSAGTLPGPASRGAFSGTSLQRSLLVPVEGRVPFVQHVGMDLGQGCWRPTVTPFGLLVPKV